MRVIFRTDASSSLGFGHLTRCLVLAQHLRERGGNCTFLMAGAETASLAERISRAGHEFISLGAGATDDSLACLNVLAGRPAADWLIVDHYGLDARWESRLREATGNVLSIDDLADRPHDCDVLVDQNYVAGMADRYRTLVPTQCRQLLGPRYALVDSSFLAQRARGTHRNGIIRRVFICFGGGDSTKYAMAALGAVRPFAATLEKIDVVLGGSRNSDGVIAAASSVPNCSVHVSTSKMAAFLAQADLAIGAGGTMNWERACLGTPTLAFAVADNQSAILAALIEGGYVVGDAAVTAADASVLHHWMSCLMANPPIIRGLASRVATLVDGLGAERIADAVMPKRLSFRRVRLEDGDHLFRWRNDPAVRASSTDPAEIARPVHDSWVAQTINDPHRELLVAECSGEPLGVVRFDLQPPEAVISVYRVPSAKPRRAGLIVQAIEWLRTHHPEIRTLTAEVLANNQASREAFEKAGFQHIKNVLAIELKSP